MHRCDVDPAAVPSAASQHESLEDLRRQVEDLKASRRRLVLAGDADSRALERALHDGIQQRLVTLAVELQQVSALVERDAPAAKTLLDDLSHDVEGALDDLRRHAERIHTPLLEEEGRLVSVLRAAAATAGVPADVEVSARSSYPAEVVRTVLLGWLIALDQGDAARPSVSVSERDEQLVFEIVSGAPLDRLRDRIEALGGRLSLQEAGEGRKRATGSLPLRRR